MMAQTQKADPAHDAEALLSLARDTSTSGRAALVERISSLCINDDGSLSETERRLTCDILRRLVNEVEQTVRIELATRLSTEPRAPRDLVMDLANDDFRVAHPILLHSPVLQDPDLIDVVHHRTRQHMLSIAMRDRVDESVSDALVAKGDTPVVRTLLENKGARISESAVRFLVEKSQTVGALRDPLVRRDELSPELATQMYAWVSAAMRQHILEKYDIDQAVLDQHVNATVEELMDDLRDRLRPGTDRPVELVELIAHANALTPRFLVELLREGEVALFEGMFAEMAGLDPAMIQRFIYEAGGEPMAIACKAILVAKADFASIFLLSRRARPGDHSVESDELSRAMKVFDRIKEDVAQGVVQRWRHDPDYLYSSGTIGAENPAQ